MTVRFPDQSRVQLWSRGDDWITSRLFWFGRQGYEPEVLPLFWCLAQGASLTIDVGAYVGWYSLVAARANPAGQVYAVEPNPQAFDRLRRNLNLNGDHRIQTRQIAFGSDAGTADLFDIGGGLSVGASLNPRQAEGQLYARIPVQVHTLDRFCQAERLDHVSLIKLDTEATELEVLHGAQSVLERDHPDIFCEVLGDRGAEVGFSQLLGPLGYDVYQLRVGDVVRGRLEDLVAVAIRETNYLFTVRTPEEIERLVRIGRVL